jgi:hypothetical protein
MAVCSVATARSQNIAAAEIFFDQDPGPGNGLSVPVGTLGAVVNFTVPVPANLGPVFHFMGIRAKDYNGK